MKEGISAYIHIPFCKSKCSYCDFFSKPGIEKLLDGYIDSLCNEIKFYSSNCNFKKLNTLYIGGGTPSLLSIELLQKLFSVITSTFEFEKNYEATIELNPDDVSFELISFLQNSFITRISLGIQSLKQETLSLMKRRATRDNSIKALNLIKENFSKRFSADLIAGFPGEDETALKENIKELITYKPEHISLYSLCVEEGTCLYSQIESGALEFDQNISDECWLEGKRFLELNGYSQYEVSNFSKSQKTQSRHNLTYWHLNNYFGFGSGAAGSLFFNDKSIRYTNTSDIENYISFWNCKENISEKKLNCFEDYNQLLCNVPCDVEIIDKETEEFEFFMMNFRLRQGVSKSEYETRFDKKIDERLGTQNGYFSKWIKDGFAEIVEDKDKDVYYRLNEKGILYLNNFLENL